MQLSELLDSRLILKEAMPSKEQAIDAMVELLSRQNKLRNPGRFSQALQQREAEFAAEIAPDIAIPHLFSNEVKEAAIAAAHTVDGRAVFLLISRNGEEHLQQLSSLAEALLEEPASNIFEKK